MSRRFGVQSEEGIHVVHDLTQEELLCEQRRSGGRARPYSEHYHG